MKVYEELSYTKGALLEVVEIQKYLNKLRIGQDNMINLESIEY